MKSEEWEEHLKIQREGSLYGGLTKYQHIERLGHDDVEGLLDGQVVIQPKIDGANMTVALIPDGKLVIATRNQAISIDGKPPTGFRGAVEYILAHQGIRPFLRGNPTLILRGEWLVQHSVTYNPVNYRRLWVFDVQQRENGTYLPFETYEPLLNEYGISYIPLLISLDSPSVEALVALLNNTPDPFGAKALEGLVIKRYDFFNKWGRQQWGKLVNADFKEANKMAFGASKKDPAALRLAASAFIPDIIIKTIQKIRDEKGEASVRNMAEVLGRVWHDVFQEYLWDFVKKEKVGDFNFRDARRLVENRTREIALAYFNGVWDSEAPIGAKPKEKGEQGG